MFTTAGKLVLQIGHRNSSGGNADTRNLHQPADSFLNRATNEIFVADGYGNQRVMAFDAGTGAFRRMWGALAENTSLNNLSARLDKLLPAWHSGRMPGNDSCISQI